MKVLTWNLREGLLDEEAGESPAEPSLDPRRRAGVLRVLHEERPDVVALQELTEWNEALLKRFADEVGLPFARLFHAPSGRHHQALLSRTPLSLPQSYHKTLEGAGAWWQTRTLLHGAFSAETRGVTVVTTHLSTASAAHRRREAEALASCLPKERTLVLGSLNAVRREERTPALEAQLPEDLAACLASPDEPSAADLLVRAGFVDSGEPSALGTAVFDTGPDEEPLVLRFDYALHTAGLEAKALSVRDDEVTRACSDHLPLVLQLTLS